MGHSASFIPRWQAVRARLLSCGGQLQPDREQEAIGDGPTARSSLPSLRCPVRMCKGVPYFHFQPRKEIGIRKKLSEVISSSRQESREKALLGEPQRRCSHRPPQLPKEAAEGCRGCVCRKCSRGGSRCSEWHTPASASLFIERQGTSKGLREDTLQTINWGWRRCLIKSVLRSQEGKAPSPSQT